jgi:hypothetical protein
MTAPAASAQSASIAAPASVRHPPSLFQTEAEFWSDEAAPAVGGRFGIPNSVMAAGAASPEDFEAFLGQLDRRRARGLALQLQRSIGNRELIALLSRNRTLQRQGPGDPAGPPPTGTPSKSPGGPRNSYGFQGIEVSSDKTSLRTQFEELCRSRPGVVLSPDYVLDICLGRAYTYDACLFGAAETARH